MQLQLASWPDIESYLARTHGILVPIGSTEQHGPTGFLGTDAIAAETVARGAGEAAGALVAPTIAIGMAEHHMAFPGTITLRPSTLIAYVRDYVLSLAAHGFARFLFVNGHGGNVPTVKAAFYEIEAERRARGQGEDGDFRCRIVNWYDGPTVSSVIRQTFGAREGSHATPSEVSVTLHAYPDHRHDRPLDPPVASGSPFYGAADFRRRHPDGRIGSDPSLASAEHGRRIAEAAIADLATHYRGFMAER
ncbi:MAG: creatininase family protein [Alphaproteobacteria bacterium]|jgi:creatinine amidohydrolase|nr:creatininase family protein [Alphaproteobacteria bacterium]